MKYIGLTINYGAIHNNWHFMSYGMKLSSADGRGRHVFLVQLPPDRRRREQVPDKRRELSSFPEPPNDHASDSVA
jgi:hypothetical protein